MHNAVAGKVDDFKHVTRFRDAVNQCLSYTMYNLWLPAKVFDIGGGTTKLPFYNNPSDGSRFPGYTIQGGSDGWITCSVRRHQEWRRGRLGLRIHYSGYPATGTFSAKVRISKVELGDTMPNESFVSITLDAPSGAGQLCIWEPVGSDEWFEVDPSASNLIVSVGRRAVGGDSSDLVILGVELVYKEDSNRVSNRTKLVA